MKKITALLLALSLPLEAQAQAQGAFGQGSVQGDEPRRLTTRERERMEIEIGTRPLWVRDAVGFDPARDVPHFENWTEGDRFWNMTAFCYAMVFLTHRTHRKIRFTTDQGVGTREWYAAARPRKGREFLALQVLNSDTEISTSGAKRFAWMLTDPEDRGEAFPVSGAEDLHAFSQRPSGERLLKDLMRSTQGNMTQIRSSGTAVLGTAIRSIWERTPLATHDDAVNVARAKAVEKILRTTGRPVPLSLHSDHGAGGHVVLVHRVEVYKGRYDLVVYDPNFAPKNGQARSQRIKIYTEDGTMKFANHEGVVTNLYHKYGYTRMSVLDFDDASTLGAARSNFLEGVRTNS